MNIHDLRIAQSKFLSNVVRIQESREKLHNRRREFITYFNADYFLKMPVNEYALGLPEAESGQNFCHTLERSLDGLGRIIGSTSFKFGLYHGRTKEDPEHKFRHSRIFGENMDDVYRNIQFALKELLKNANDENLPGLIKSRISPMFKGKILSTYHPERFLNVFSEDHLDYFLKKFDKDPIKLKGIDPIIKRELLAEIKNGDEIMRHWPLDLFSVFLYDYFPGRPPKKGAPEVPSTDPLFPYQEPTFPTGQKGIFINGKIIPASPSQPSEGKGGKTKNIKPDYEMDARRAKMLGDRGEKIVMDLEIEKLNGYRRPDLADRVERVSLKSDAFGYDVLSFERDGTERYIEVKATSAGVGKANFFLTDFELRKAAKLENYHLYIVFDITSIAPKVWSLANPFNPESEHVVRQPVKYRVSINADFYVDK